MVVLLDGGMMDQSAVPRIVFGNPAPEVFAGILAQPEIAVSDGSSCDSAAVIAVAAPACAEAPASAWVP